MYLQGMKHNIWYMIVHNLYQSIVYIQISDTFLYSKIESKEYRGIMYS